MSEISQKEFADAVASAIKGVHHLFQEVDRLVLGLRELLAQGKDPLVPVRGSLEKGHVNPWRFVVRHQHRNLFGAAALDEADEEEEDEGGEEVEDEHDEEAGAEGKMKRGPAELAADQPLLAVLVDIFYPDNDSFEPYIAYAVMDTWGIGNQPAPEPGYVFRLPRYMLKMIPRALAGKGSLGHGERVTTKASSRTPGMKKGAGGRISCRLPRGVKTVSLHSLSKPEDLEALAADMKQMWADARRVDR